MATNEDYEIRRTIWDSKIPVEFAIENSQPMRTNQSSYALLPRISYFSLHIDQPLRILFGDNIDEKDLDNIWLLHNGEMLRWHYPIGVLYDMHNINLEKKVLPWLITIKQKDFPDQLVRCLSKEVMKFNFTQTLKEASQMKHKRNIASTMTKDEHDRLFDSICNDRFNDFWTINEKLMRVEIAEREDGISKIPIRFYQSSLPFRQIHIPLRLNKDGQFVNTTLRDALDKTFSEFEKIESNYIAISHGIELPMDTTTIWMARNLSYPDNFVHIVVLRLNKIV